MKNLISLQYTRPPRLPENIVPRERLFTLLEANKNNPLTLINASAGYGKTVLLLDYCKRYPSEYGWLTAAQNITNPAVFVTYMIFSIKKNYPEFGENTLSYLENFSGKWSDNNITELVTVFLNELVSPVNAGFTIIIDDFQNLENENNKGWVNTLFTEFFTAAPENLRFIISTRQIPSFKTSRLEAKRQLFAITTADLCFNIEEIAILAESYNVNNSNTCGMLLKQTGGWITAMHMLLQSPRKSHKENFEFTESLYNYIAEDIFTGIDDGLKYFLFQTAYLESFNDVFCDKLLNITNSKDLIKKLVSKNIFLESAYTEEGNFFFYQKLFADFLKKHVSENFGLQEKKSNYLKIADIYISEAKPEDALWFLINAEDTERFTEIIRANIEPRFDSLDLYTIEKWLGLAGDLCFADPHLRYYRLKYFIKANKLENISLDEFVLPQQDDIELYYKILLLKAEYLLLTGKLTETLEILNGAVSKINITVIKKQYLLLYCKTYYRLGFEYYDRLTKIAEESIRYYDENNIRNEKLEVIGYLASIDADAWNDQKAIKYYEMALYLEKNTKMTFVHLSNLIDLYSTLGQYEKARQYIIKAEEIFNKYPTPYFQRLLIRGQVRFYSALGNNELAIKIWAKLDNNSSIKGNSVLAWSFYIQFAELYYFAGKNDKVSQFLDLSKKYLDKDEEYENVIYEFFENYYRNRDVCFPETENAVLNMLEYHKKNNLPRLIPQMEYYLAFIHLELELFTSAEKYIILSLRKYSDKNLSTFLEAELLLSRKLFDLAISQNIEKKFIGTVFDAIKNKLSLDFISDEYRKELNSRINRLTDICFSPFGNTEFFLRGEPVADDKWIRKKSKILLAYLMSDPEKIHTKDKIMDLFFDEVPGDKADTIYHSTLYNIRTALKIYDIKTDKPKRSKDKTFDYNPQYILYEDKTLRLNPDFYYRADNIEFEKHYNKTRLPGLSNEKKIRHSIKAIELHKGDFLPGYYDSWAEELRIKYKNMYISLLEELIKLLESEKRYEDVIKYSERLLNEDRLNDPAHISIISEYAKLGSINMAKSRLDFMMKIYDEELGERPSAKTLEKINNILNEAKNL